MQAVILAAGKSTRTHPLTVTRPKPLLKVANKTLLEYNLDALNYITKEVIIVVGFKAELIKKHIGTRYRGINIKYVEQKHQLGTGNAILAAEDLVKDRFLVLMGDDIYSKDDLKAITKHNCAVLAKEVNNPTRFGVLLVENNLVKKIIEKPKRPVSNLANTGCYVLDKNVFSLAKSLKKSKRGEYELVDVINAVASNTDVTCQIVKHYWFPVTYPWSLLELNEFFVKKLKKTVIKGTIEDGCTVDGPLFVGKGSVIKAGTYIVGPVVIGENCEIGPNSYLRAGTTIGNNCKIGQAVEIKNSIIGDYTKVPHLSYVGDSVIGEGCNLGAGTIIANLRHDNANVKSAVKGKLIDTGRRKFGTVFGDNVHTGISTSIFPGRKLWPNTCTRPGQIVDKDIL